MTGQTDSSTVVAMTIDAPAQPTTDTPTSPVGQPTPSADPHADPTPDRSDTPRRGSGSGEPRLASAASWAVLVASFGLSAATWIALARLAGFDGHFGVGSAVISLAWLMPVAVDGYVVTALVLWMSPVPAKVAAFARKNTYAAAGVGVAAQSAFHCASVASATQSPWRAGLAAVVGALPPAVAALAVHMRALIRRESSKPVGQEQRPIVAEVVGQPTPALTSAPDGPTAPTPDEVADTPTPVGHADGPTTNVPTPDAPSADTPTPRRPRAPRRAVKADKPTPGVGDITDLPSDDVVMRKLGKVHGSEVPSLSEVTAIAGGSQSRAIRLRNKYAAVLKERAS